MTYWSDWWTQKFKSVHYFFSLQIKGRQQTIVFHLLDKNSIFPFIIEQLILYRIYSWLLRNGCFQKHSLLGEVANFSAKFSLSLSIYPDEWFCSVFCIQKNCTFFTECTLYHSLQKVHHTVMSCIVSYCTPNAIQSVIILICSQLLQGSSCTLFPSTCKAYAHCHVVSLVLCHFRH